MIVDINDVLFLVYKIMYENYSLFDLAIERNLEQTLNSFESNINVKLECNCSKRFFEQIKDKKDHNKNKQKLIKWLNENYHPKVLVEDISNAIIQYKYQERIKKLDVYQKLSHFTSFAEDLREMMMNSNVPMNKSNEELNEHFLLERFFHFVDHLVKIIEG